MENRVTIRPVGRGVSRINLTSSHLRRALEAIEEATAGMSSEQLLRHPDGKWCTSEILEHLARAFSGTTKGIARCLAASRPSATVPTVKQRVTIAVVVGLGRLPSGRQAPERTRPKGIPAADAMHAVRQNLIAMDEALAQCEQRFGQRTAVLNHPILGPLTVAQWRKFHWVHTQHHMKQIAQLCGRG